MTTDDTPDDAPPVDVERELEIAEAAALAQHEPESTDETGHPLDHDGPGHYKYERVDGHGWMYVPQGEFREPFIAALNERKAAELAAATARAEEIAKYKALSPLERARSYSDREAAAIEAMIAEDAESEGVL